MTRSFPGRIRASSRKESLTLNSSFWSPPGTAFGSSSPSNPATQSCVFCKQPGRRLTESKDSSRHFAGFHCAEGLVDFVKRAAAADHVVEVKSALAIEVEILGHIEME